MQAGESGEVRDVVSMHFCFMRHCNSGDVSVRNQISASSRSEQDLMQVRKVVRQGLFAFRK